MLRNPVELVYSLHAEMFYRLCEDEPDFPTAWSLQAARRRGEHLPKTNPNGIKGRLQYEFVGRLGEQVARLLATFPREQVHLIVFDDFVRSPAAAYAGVLEFLGLPFDGRTVFPK